MSKWCTHQSLMDWSICSCTHPHCKNKRCQTIDAMIYNRCSIRKMLVGCSESVCCWMGWHATNLLSMSPRIAMHYCVLLEIRNNVYPWLLSIIYNRSYECESKQSKHSARLQRLGFGRRFTGFERIHRNNCLVTWQYIATCRLENTVHFTSNHGENKWAK